MKKPIIATLAIAVVFAMAALAQYVNYTGTMYSTGGNVITNNQTDVALTGVFGGSLTGTLNGNATTAYNLTTIPTNNIVTNMATGITLGGQFNGNPGGGNGTSSEAFGVGASAAGTYSVAVGESTMADFNNDLAIGYSAQNQAANGTAVGFFTTVSGANGVALGYYAVAGASGIAIGSGVTAGASKIVIGSGQPITGNGASLTNLNLIGSWPMGPQFVPVSDGTNALSLIVSNAAYAQINLQNLHTNGSSDYVLTEDAGNPNMGYADFFQDNSQFGAGPNYLGLDTNHDAGISMVNSNFAATFWVQNFATNGRIMHITTGTNSSGAQVVITNAAFYPSIAGNLASNVLQGTTFGSFTGNGGGLTNLNATNLIGVVQTANLSANNLTNAAGFFFPAGGGGISAATAQAIALQAAITNTINNAQQFTNNASTNYFGITSATPATLGLADVIGGWDFITASGYTLLWNGDAVITNNQKAVTLTGTFTGNGGGLTNIQPAAVTNGAGFWAAAPSGGSSATNWVTSTLILVPNSQNTPSLVSGTNCIYVGIGFTTVLWSSSLVDDSVMYPSGWVPGSYLTNLSGGWRSAPGSWGTTNVLGGWLTNGVMSYAFTNVFLGGAYGGVWYNVSNNTSSGSLPITANLEHLTFCLICTNQGSLPNVNFWAQCQVVSPVHQ